MVGAPAFGRLDQDVGPADTVLELQGPGDFVEGDLVMLWQVTGLAEPAAGNGYADVGDVGRYTLRRAVEIDTTIFTLDQPVGSAYPAAHTQVVEVLEYDDLTRDQHTGLQPPWHGRRERTLPQRRWRVGSPHGCRRRGRARQRQRGRRRRHRRRPPGRARHAP